MFVLFCMKNRGDKVKHFLFRFGIFITIKRYLTYKRRLAFLFYITMENIQHLPENQRTIYEKHWNTIQKSVKNWRFKDVYHFPLLGNENINNTISDVIQKYTQNVKVNAAFGFILQDRTTDELKFFHPSNNSMMLDSPKLIKQRSDLQDLLNDMEKVDILEYARTQRPSSKWVVEKIICMRLDIFKLPQ